LVKWCETAGLYNLALVLAVVGRQWNRAAGVAGQGQGRLLPCLVKWVFVWMVKRGQEQPLVKYLSNFPVSIMEKPDHAVTDHLQDRDNTHVLTNVAARLERAGLIDWAGYFSILLEKWDRVERLMERCQDKRVLVNLVVFHSATKGIRNWSICDKFLPLCTHAHILQIALAAAVLDSAKHMVASLVPRVDLCFKDEGHTFLSVGGDNSVHKMLIGAGLSTYQREMDQASGMSLVTKQKLTHGCVNMLRLYHRSGVCSNHALFELNARSSSTLFCIFSPAYTNKGVQREVRQYLDMAASTPLSLLDLSRQAVSHCLGVQPGRQERIQALPVPSAVKKCLCFADLLAECPEEQMCGFMCPQDY
jgi:hypothetical protein